MILKVYCIILITVIMITYLYNIFNAKNKIQFYSMLITFILYLPLLYLVIIYE